MKFRKRLFYGLAILALLYIVLTLANAGNVAENATNEGSEGRTESEQELAEAAAMVGMGIGVMIVLVCGIPVFLFFALMGWRNGVGLRNEQRHREMLAAQMQNGNLPHHQNVPPAYRSSHPGWFGDHKDGEGGIHSGN